MVKGIGISMVSISDVDRLCGGVAGKTADQQNAFVRSTFTEREMACALGRRSPSRYLAGRLAAKRAAVKAMAPLATQGFDLHCVEILTKPSGAPYVEVGPQLRDALNEVGASEMLVSITNEDDHAAAVVLVQ